MNDDVDAYTLTEGTTPTFEADLEAADGTAISGASLLTLTLTIRHDYTHEILADREAADVLNTSGVVVNNAGHLTWAITALESELINRALPSEPHRCLLAWTYLSGSVIKVGSYEFLLWIERNAAATPQD